MLEQDIERVFFSEEDLKKRVAEIAAEINRDYAGKEPMLISVLRGSFVFMADLIRKIEVPCTVDFMGRFLLRQGHHLLRPGADHQGPVRRY